MRIPGVLKDKAVQHLLQLYSVEGGKKKNENKQKVLNACAEWGIVAGLLYVCVCLCCFSL